MRLKMTKLSIITINRNNAAGLRKTIESVLSQTFTDFEYIIIDGASTDESVEVIKEYADKITFWVSEPDKGIYNAMNKGILKANGEYCLFLNSGDYLVESDVFKKIFDNVQSDEDIIYGDLKRTFPDGEKDIVKMPDCITPSFLYNASLAHPSTFIKRYLFDKYGLYNELYEIVADHAFFVKVFLMGRIKYKHINVVVSNFMMDGTCSKMSNVFQISAEREKSFVSQLPQQYIELINDFNSLSVTFNKFRNNKAILLLNKLSNRKNKLKRYVNMKIKSFLLFKIVNPYKLNYLDIPIIINNRNRVSYLNRLINSLKIRGYRNIHIIDNNSDFPLLLDYYKNSKCIIHKLNYNGGFCSLWDSNIFDTFFKNQYYIYTDSDMELPEECPDNFVEFMLFNLWKYKSIDKIGLSLIIDDLPDNYLYKKNVIEHETQFWKDKFDKNLYNADVDTTFALYRINKKGPAGYIRAVRTTPPYSIRHLPWYQDSNELSSEDVYYNAHSETRTHWTTYSTK